MSGLIVLGSVLGEDPESGNLIREIYSSVDASLLVKCLVLANLDLGSWIFVVDVGIG